jgi:hypothetical protein
MNRFHGHPRGPVEVGRGRGSAVAVVARLVGHAVPGVGGDDPVRPDPADDVVLLVRDVDRPVGRHHDVPGEVQLGGGRRSSVPREARRPVPGHGVDDSVGRHLADAVLHAAGDVDGPVRVHPHPPVALGVLGPAEAQLGGRRQAVVPGVALDPRPPEAVHGARVHGDAGHVLVHHGVRGEPDDPDALVRGVGHEEVPAPEGVAGGEEEDARHQVEEGPGRGTAVPGVPRGAAGDGVHGGVPAVGVVDLHLVVVPGGDVDLPPRPEGDVRGVVELRREGIPLGVPRDALAADAREGAVLLEAPEHVVVPVEDVELPVGPEPDLLHPVEARGAREEAVAVVAPGAAPGDGVDRPGRRREGVGGRSALLPDQAVGEGVDLRVAEGGLPPQGEPGAVAQGARPPGDGLLPGLHRDPLQLRPLRRVHGVDGLLAAGRVPVQHGARTRHRRGEQIREGALRREGLRQLLRHGGELLQVVGEALPARLREGLPEADVGGVHLPVPAQGGLDAARDEGGQGAQVHGARTLVRPRGPRQGSRRQQDRKKDERPPSHRAPPVDPRRSPPAVRSRGGS